MEDYISFKTSTSVANYYGFDISEGPDEGATAMNFDQLLKAIENTAGAMNEEYRFAGGETKKAAKVFQRGLTLLHRELMFRKDLSE